jgi:predicted acetyltransferase
MTIRSLSTDEKNSLKKLLHYCFYEPEYWSLDSDMWDKFFNILDFQNVFGFYQKDQLTSTYIIHNFQCYIRGKLLSLGGVAGVTTLPEFRHQGQIRALAKKSLELMRSNGQFISALYPFKFSFYRKFGYEHCFDYYSLTSKTQNIAIPQSFQPLKVVEIPREKSFEKLQPLWKKVGKNYNLIIHQDKANWDFFIAPKNTRIMAAKNENDEIVGFAITQLKKLPEPYAIRLIVKQLCCFTSETRYTFLDYIKKHGDQIKDFQWYYFGDFEILDCFIERWSERVKILHQGGPMFRIVDVLEALLLINYPKEVEGSLLLGIKDNFAEWNTGTYLLEFKDGKINCTKKNNSLGEADIILDIKAFNQLFIGYRSLRDLELSFRIQIKNSKKAELLAKAFPKKHTRLFTDF